MTLPNDTRCLPRILHQYWGFRSFLPLQYEAMSAVLHGRDSLVVMPTGGGKSLCYQVPALCLDGLALVVSPLISLMKDQVDSLRASGIPAAQWNSTLAPHESRTVIDQIRTGTLKLLYIAPERLVNGPVLDLLASQRIAFVAVDEAHCVSMWGHDFRPQYRELAILKKTFSRIGIHAYTATATEQVRQDIVEQLSLDRPEILVGSFDRPNLTYSIARRTDRVAQIVEILERHRNESGIIYCISRKNTEETSSLLNNLGYQTAPYHAGMSDEDRLKNQESFREDRIRIIVATIAFGMGIDKPDVRFVIHSELPKSLEHYQQESGRAGRDGLEAECVLLYSERDAYLWKRVIEDQPAENQQAAFQPLKSILAYCRGTRCRHRAIVQHFGQKLDADCGNHCDICRGDYDAVPDPDILGQKILSSIYRQGQRFGAAYTAKVLKGSHDQQVLANRHDQLTTYGILRDASTASIRHWIDQLLTQAFLEKTPGEYPLLRITDLGWQLLRGEVTPKLIQLKEIPKRQIQQRQSAADSWDGVDRRLFEELRFLRLDLARQRNWPPYVVFSDVALRDMARLRPSNLDQLLNCRGVGQKKCESFGRLFLDCIADYCRKRHLEINRQPTEPR